METEIEAVQASSTLSERDQVGNDHAEQEAQIVNDELCPDDIYHHAKNENIEQSAFRCLECRMLFLPTSHVDGSNILDFSSCRRHIGVDCLGQFGQDKPAEFLNVNFFARADLSYKIFAPNFEEPIFQ